MIILSRVQVINLVLLYYACLEKGLDQIFYIIFSELVGSQKMILFKRNPHYSFRPKSQLFNVFRNFLIILWPMSAIELFLHLPAEG